jgi:hypothetical protein|eukprot:TRINITY_DN63466_c0_g1_i1.p1 TRINITY_DN63466_c0_g1~~TRINITY_DN63466_c0_g1_i1.p1  ORF type:complete len:369 (-),score=54.13 TRINITY_DN63466_c0_g1_i1:96-1136(-)
MAEEEDKHAEKRAVIFEQSIEASNAEPRWGYFGIPGSLAIGDNSYAPRIVRKRPSDDDPVEPLRNIQTGPVKKGVAPLDGVYFKFEPPLCIGDPYQDPKSINNTGKIWMLHEDVRFWPPGRVRHSINKLGYEYMPHCDSVKDPVAVKEMYTDYQPPRQIYCGPSKKGGGGVYTNGVLFGFPTDPNPTPEMRNALPEHIADEYDGARKLRAQELEEHRSKMQEQPYKPMYYGNRSFQDDISTYCYEEPTHIPREKKEEKLNCYPHEAPFFPSQPPKKGILRGLIGGVPEYIEDPLPGGATRKAKDEDAPVPFKLGNLKASARPTPSVTTNLRNMRNERPSSFARPHL